MWSQPVAPEASGVMMRKLIRGEPADEEGFLKEFSGDERRELGVAVGRFLASKGRVFS